MIFFWILMSPVLVQAAELDGTWRQDCARSYQREEAFQGERATFSERNFSDPACASLSAETLSRGTIALGESVLEPSGARQIDFVFTSVHIKPATPQTAEHYNRRRICGYRDWAAGVEREVTGRDCDFHGLGSVVRVPSAGEKRFGIVKIIPGELYLGALSPERDGSSPETRPMVLDLRPYRLQR